MYFQLGALYIDKDRTSLFDTDDNMEPYISYAICM